MTVPAVTVLMSVHNGAAHLEEALQSVLRQTFRDFELLVIDDGSTDASPTILRGCGDPRLAVHRNERNLGLVASLNSGLDHARGEFIARMDADDVALPRRLERQVDFLRHSPQTGLCGTWFRMFGAERSVVVRPPTGAEDMAARLFHESPLAHPSVMLRRAVFARHGLRYSPDFPHAEDFELWTRVALVTELANLPEVLLLYREHAGQVSRLRESVQKDSVRRIVLRQLHRIHPSATEAEREAHAAIISNRGADAARIGGQDVESWLQGLVDRNDVADAGFPRAAFRRVIAMVWWRYCSTRAGRPGMLKAFYNSRLSRDLPLKYRLGMLAVRAKAITAHA